MVVTGVMGCALNISEMFVVFITTDGGAVLGVLSLDVTKALTGSSVTGFETVLVDPDSTTLGAVTGLTSCTIVVRSPSN